MHVFVESSPLFGRSRFFITASASFPLLTCTAFHGRLVRQRLPCKCYNRGVLSLSLSSGLCVRSLIGATGFHLYFTSNQQRGGGGGASCLKGLKG